MPTVFSLQGAPSESSATQPNPATPTAGCCARGQRLARRGGGSDPPTFPVDYWIAWGGGIGGIGGGATVGGSESRPRRPFHPPRLPVPPPPAARSASPDTPSPEEAEGWGAPAMAQCRLWDWFVTLWLPSKTTSKVHSQSIVFTAFSLAVFFSPLLSHP